MTTEKLLSELGARNIRLRRNRDELVLTGNQKALEPSLIDQVRAHKTALLEMIDRGSSALLSPGVTITPEMVTLVNLTQREIDALVQVVPGGAANVQDIYPLMPLQEGILFHHLMESRGDPYLMGMILSFSTREKLDRYAEAVQWVVDRHDILRTAVQWEGLREPVQVVWRKAQVSVEEVELTGDGDAVDQLYERFHPRHYRIDVRQAPLLRAYVARDRVKGGWLMMRLLHHLIGDHSSMELMQQEVAARLLGREAELPRPEPFRSLVVQARNGVGSQEHESFFRGRLGDVEEPTAPFGLLKAMGDGTGIEEATLNLERDLTRRIRERAKKLKVSAATLSHLAWACIVARTSVREEAVFGTVLSGQMQRGSSDDQMMGLFINTLPVRIAVGNDGVEEAVGKTQMALADLVRHEHASLALAQKCSGVAAPAPLFTTLLNYRHIRASLRTEEDARAWEGIRVLRGEERTNYPLSLAVNDLGESISVTVQAEASIGSMRLCEFMRTALESLAEALESGPARPVRTLEVLPSGERDQVLFEWNDTAVEYPREKCIHELFEEQVEKSPGAKAVVYEGASLTYRDLNRRANRLARYLRELGIGPDRRVGICMERGPEIIVAILAVWKAGAGYVPLDPAYPSDRLLWMLEDSAPSGLLTQEHLKKNFDSLGETMAVIALDDRHPLWQNLPESNLDSREIGLVSSHLAYIIYTSGSTGKPKGVMVEHRGLPNFAMAQRRNFPVEPEDRILQFASLSFDASVFELSMALLTGACLYLPRRGEALAGETLIEVTARLGITHATLPPAVLAALPRGSELSSLRLIVVGGEALSDSVASRWVQGRRLINAYGPTETTIWIAGHECRAQESGSPPIGRPIANVRIYILDSRLQPVPVGVAGELYIAGVGLARGYWKRPEITAERFIPDPYARQHGMRMYRTGDLGRWKRDGEIEFLGRNDFQVKVRGYRIELGEIEARLAEFAGVSETVVIVREDASGEKQLAAYFTVAETDEKKSVAVAPDAPSLRAHLTALLPNYMVPSTYVRLDRLPLTVSGKLDRKALPRPDGDSYSAREYEAPQGSVETRLAEIWMELLGVERVGRKDNFFELGGHSLLAVRAVARIQREMGIETATKDLFSFPQLESFAAMIALPRYQSAERALPVREQGMHPPVFFAHGADDQTGHAWAIAPHIDPDIPVYELPAQQKNGSSRLRTIEGQAQRMVRMIRAVQPAGPYRIIGYCFGSFLAYEMARQLVGADEEVFLALLDFRLVSGHTDILSLVPSAPPNQDLKIKLLSAIDDYIVDSRLPESARETVAGLKHSSKSLEELFYYCKDMGWVPEPWRLLTPVRLRSLLVHLADMERGPYLFSRLPLDVHLFAAQDEERADELPDDFLKLIPGARLKSYKVPGTHDTMVESPNTVRLGRALSQAIGKASRKNALGVSKNKKTKASGAPPASSLVCFPARRSSSREQGAPLFCVPGTPPGARCFTSLADAFRGSRPIYGLQPRGLDESENSIPHTTIEAEAVFYIKDIERVCPDGPVHLLGHLRGGWAAFEMALNLRSAGRQVLSLTLIDTEPPDDNSRDLREYTVTEVVRHLLEISELLIGRSSVTLADLERKRPARQREILIQLLMDCEILPVDAVTGDVYRILHFLGTGLRTRYIPRSAFAGPVHLIGAAEGKGSEEKNGAGWERWASGVNGFRSPGNLITMLRPPHVGDLAEILEGEMNAAETNSAITDVVP